MEKTTKRLLLLLLFVHGVLLIPLILGGYPKYPASIEPSFVSFVSFLKEHPFSLWNPTWYLGFPMRFAGPPVVPILVALLSFLTGSVMTATNMFVYFLLLSFPLSLFVLARHILRSDKLALLATFLTMFFPSVFFLHPKVFELAKQTGFVPWQTMLAGYYGGVKHLAGIVLLPIVVLVTHRGLEKWSFRAIIASSFAMAVLLLTDLETFVSLLVVMTFLFVSQAKKNTWEQVVRNILLLLGVSGVFTLWWYTPGSIWHLLRVPSLKGESLWRVVWELLQGALTVIPVALAILHVKVKGVFQERRWSISLLWLASFVALTVVIFVSDPDFVALFTKFGVEIGIGIGLVGSLAISNLFKKNKQGAFVVVILIFFLSVLSIRDIPNVLGRRKVPTPTIEYKTSRALSALSPTRVYLSGSTSFWLNLFTDIEQVRGGGDMAAIHPWWAHASYQIREGKDGETSVLWLQAMRVSHIVVHGKDSEEFFHDFTYPQKFQGKLDEVSPFSRDDSIYKVSSPGGLLAIAVPLKELEKKRPPQKGDDKDPIRDYVSLLQQGSVLSFQKNEQNVLTASGNVREDDAIVVGYAYDSNWTATNEKGERLTIKKDPLGFLVILPERTGNTTIQIASRVPVFDIVFGWILFFAGIGGLWYYKKNPAFFRKHTHVFQTKSDVDEEIEY